ncbi:MAG: glycerol-3-phosphate 1-O-acyltransferase PlsY [Chitinophagales bacterium]|nr:glycerol-3-phosphate 1-O-acyltransferase PlsY [Hyphomicrobiales bacterium]
MQYQLLSGDIDRPHVMLALMLGYLLGSIPFGLIFTRAAGLGDIRAIGSGNIGATNVLRTGHKGLAAATLLADATKGGAAVLIFYYWSYSFGVIEALIAGLAAFIGHLYPVWLRFKGGKGVATYLGVLAAISLKVFAVFAVIWLAVAFFLRYSSAAALAAAATIPLTFMMLDKYAESLFFAIMSALIFWKHRANIGRLWRGEEPKIGARNP